jgi:hypothetical protein
MSNLQGLTSANSLYHGRAGKLVRREATAIGRWLGIRPKEAVNHRETITVAFAGGDALPAAHISSDRSIRCGPLV